MVMSVVVVGQLGTAMSAAGRVTARESQPVADQPVTFAADVSPILVEHCGECHSPGGSAPFSLVTYADVRPRAKEIAAVTQRRTMPPWKPVPGYGEFQGVRRLSDRQLRVVQQWVDAGAPQGDTVPISPPAGDAWRLGPPDLILEMPRPYKLAAEGADRFRHFVIPVSIPNRRYVKAWEFRPGNPKVVHHAKILLDRTGTSRRLDEADTEPGYEGGTPVSTTSPAGYFLGWTPGRTPYDAPDGMAWPLDRNTDLVLSLHLQPSVAEEPVQASVGLYFTDAPPTRAPAVIRLTRQDFVIPAGEQRYTVSDSFVLPASVDVYSLQPHAHNLAREVKAFATLPDGTLRWLIYINDWDSHWQDDYTYAVPLSLPAGTSLTMEWTYDNSARNRRNPFHPPRQVSFGSLTSDEMSELLLQVVPHDPSDLDDLKRAAWVNQRPQTIAGYEVRLRRDPQNVGLHNDVAQLYWDAGEVGQAAEHFSASLRLKADPRVALQLGVVLGAQHSFESAIENIEHALELRPAWPPALAELAWIFATSSDARFYRPKQALPLAFRASQLTQRQSPRALDVLAAALAALGDFDAAMSAAETALLVGLEDGDATAAGEIRDRLTLYKRRIPYRIAESAGIP